MINTPKLIDLTGMKFGEWTVIERAEYHICQDGSKRVMWLCRCSCGTISEVSGSSLKRGGSKSCGHTQRKYKPIQPGDVFTYLTVLEEDFEAKEKHKRKGRWWKCRCKCGNIVSVEGNCLKTGNTKSCGCWSAERKRQTESLVGQKYGRLTVVERAPNHIAKSGVESIAWHCICDCGKRVTVNSRDLKTGNTKSCGCLKTEKQTKHGLSDSRLYHVWEGMKNRCYNKNSVEYKNYGGRGIYICDEWRDDFNSFYKWAIENGYDEFAGFGECTIDRIDYNKGYSESNCRFLSIKEQSWNKSTNRYIEYNNETKCVAEWCDILDLNYKNTLYRLDKGWSMEEIVSYYK